MHNQADKQQVGCKPDGGRGSSVALDKLYDVLRDPYRYLRDLKKAGGRKLIGCMGLYVPEELVHAAGLIPVRLPASPEPVTLAGTRVHANLCGYPRSVVDMAMRGQFGIFDGLVWHVCCDALHVSDVMKRNTPQMGWFKELWFPQVRSRPQAGEFVLDEILGLKGVLEQKTGTEITPNRLQESIDLYNENRALLRTAYDIRRAKSALVSAQDMLAIVQSGMVMPKEEHTDLLRTVVQAWEKAAPTPENRVRLLISGSLCQAVPVELLDAVNQCGAVIVDDDLYVGSRYAQRDVNGIGDPVEALARRYLTMDIPCPTLHPSPADWGEYLIGLVRRSNAQGVVTIIVKSCEPHLFFYPRVRRYLQAKDIPELMLEVASETRLSDIEQKKTRLQAFVEMLS